MTSERSRGEGILFGSVLVVVVFLLALSELRDADAWWHLKTGELILKEGILRADPFSYVLAGRSWITFEWLSQVLFRLAYAVAGSASLVFLKSILLATLFGLLWRLNRNRSFLSAAVALAAALGMRHEFVVRPFIFDWFAIALLLSIYWNVSFRSPPRRLLWVVPLLSAVWTNLHGGAAILAPGLTLAAALVERWRERRVPFGFWVSVAGLSAAALLVNPHGRGVLTQLWGTIFLPGKEMIYEWHSPTRQYFGIYGLFLIGGAVSLRGVFKRRPFAAAWLVLAALASIRMQRSIALYLVIAAPLIAEFLGGLTLPSSFARARERVKRLPRPAGIAAGCFGLCLCAWLHTLWAAPGVLRRWGLGGEAPFAGAAAFLERAGVRGRMFNEYEAGGPLIWRLHPERKVFIDGRSLEYGSDLVRRALTWYRPAVWKSLEDEYLFDYAVVARSRVGAYTTKVLDARPDWVLVFWDDDAMVYLKRTRENARLIRRHGYLLLRPGIGTHQYIERLIRAKRAGGLLAELDRSLEQAPDCENALQVKAYVLARIGRLKEAAETARRNVRAYPGHVQPWLTLGWVLAAANDLEAAERAYEAGLRVVRRDERSAVGADILNNLARVRERRGDLGGALRGYRRALRWNPRQGDARASLRRLGGKI